MGGFVMGPCQGKWQPATKPFILPMPSALPPGAGAGSWLNDYWRDARPDAVGRCRVDLPIGAPLPDDLEERGWTVVDRYRERARWTDVVVLEGDTLPKHVAGEYMTEWHSFDDLREAVARALAAAFSPPTPEDETPTWPLGPWPDVAGGMTTGTRTGDITATTSTIGNVSYLTFNR